MEITTTHSPIVASWRCFISFFFNNYVKFTRGPLYSVEFSLLVLTKSKLGNTNSNNLLHKRIAAIKNQNNSSNIKCNLY